MSKLPDGWTAAPLGDLLTAIVGGGTPSKSNVDYFQGSIPFMTVKDMHERFIADTQDHISEKALESSASSLIPADTLVVASRMSLGKIARPQIPVAVNQDLKALFLHEGIDKTYIEYAWRAKESQIQAMGTGTTVKGIRLEDIRGLEIPVAPSPEQTRIADQLDKLLVRIQACNDRIDAIPKLLKRFRQAVMSAALAGDLTAERRRSTEACEWSSTTISSICEHSRVITYGVVKLGDEVHNGTPCLRTSNVRWLRFELDGMKRIAPELSAQYGRTILRGGEVLVNVRGTLGGVAVASGEMEGWNVSREVAVLPVDPAVAIPSYVAFWVASENSQRWLSSMEKGVAYVGINIEDLRQLPIRLPSLAEQTVIVAEVESLLSLSGRIEARYTSARNQAQRLTALVLAKAFRGELVPQNPEDESAASLLERIKERRTTPVIQKKNGRAAKEKPMKNSPPSSLSEIVSRMGEDSFTFEQLRDKASRDYESLKEELFALLADSESGLKQVFDADSKSMQFKRVRR